jgi:hypothetical protein
MREEFLRNEREDANYKAVTGEYIEKAAIDNSW